MRSLAVMLPLPETRPSHYSRGLWVYNIANIIDLFIDIQLLLYAAFL